MMQITIQLATQLHTIELAIGFPLLVYCGYTCLQEFSLGSCSNMLKMCSPSPIRCFMAQKERNTPESHSLAHLPFLEEAEVATGW